jgi:hypothetical protein
MGPYVVNAARTAVDANTRANVDIHQVYEQSEAKQMADAKTGSVARRLDQKFTELNQTPFLNPAELRDLSVILAKETPSADETKRAADLRAEADKRVTEANSLAQKKDADLTPADRNRLRELTAMRPIQTQTMVKIQALYQQLVNEENEKNDRAGIAGVRAAVAKLAKDKGIAEVYDVTSMVVAPVDLTKDAVEKVQVKKK